MTATKPNMLTLNRELDIAKAQFKILKTPALRRRVKDLEAQLLEAKRLPINRASAKRNGKRRRGVKMAALHG